MVAWIFPVTLIIIQLWIQYTLPGNCENAPWCNLYRDNNKTNIGCTFLLHDLCAHKNIPTTLELNLNKIKNEHTNKKWSSQSLSFFNRWLAYQQHSTVHVIQWRQRNMTAYCICRTSEFNNATLYAKPWGELLHAFKRWSKLQLVETITVVSNPKSA